MENLSAQLGRVAFVLSQHQVTVRRPEAIRGPRFECSCKVEAVASTEAIAEGLAWHHQAQALAAAGLIAGPDEQNLGVAA